MILLAADVLDGRPDQRCFGAIDLAVRRNAYGRQVDSLRGRPRRRRPRRPVPRRVHPGPRASSGSGPGSRSWPATTAARPRPPGPGHRRLVPSRSCPATPGSTQRFLPGGPGLMSGHSKWATIKHQKGAKDKARGKLFAKLIRQVEVAAREGGGDLDVQRHAAHDVHQGPGGVGARSTPSTAPSSAAPASSKASPTSRSPTRATRPCGVAVLVDVLTDNRNRTGAEVRNVFTKMGGSHGRAGLGVVAVQPPGRRARPGRVAEDDVMLAALDAGADDIADDGDTWRITSEPGTVERSARRLEAAGIAVESAESTHGLLHHRAPGHRPRTPRRCCGSSTPSRTTTTCRTCTPTSTSPTSVLDAVDA